MEFFGIWEITLIATAVPFLAGRGARAHGIHVSDKQLVRMGILLWLILLFGSTAVRYIHSRSDSAQTQATER
jgi:hypothetical protein